MSPHPCGAIAAHDDGARPAFIPEPDALDYLRLARQVSTVISALPIQLDGRAQEIEELAGFLGLKKTDLVIAPVRVGHHEMTIIAARSDVWRRQKDSLVELKRLSRHCHRRVMLVSAGWLRRNEFLTNCAVVSLSRSTKVTATLRFMIADYLQINPRASLRDCAGLITDHEDPIGALLSMAAEGLLKIDLRRRIDLESPVYFA